MSGHIWAVLLFLCMWLELGASCALQRERKSEDHLQTARKDEQTERLDSEAGQNEMSFVNTEGTPSSRLTEQQEDKLTILARSNRHTRNSETELDPVLIKDIMKAGYEIEVTPVSLSNPSVNTNSAPLITNYYNPKNIPESIVQNKETTVSPFSHNSEISRLSLDSSVPTVQTPGVEETKSLDHGEQGILPDRSTLISVFLDGRKSRNANTSASNANRFFLRPQSGLNINGQDVHTIAIGNQEAFSSGTGGIDFRPTSSGQDDMHSHSRSRRSWIWNQFFVIEEYSGPEPVLIGRLHSSVDKGDGRTKYILKGEGAGSVFVIDSRTGNIHVTKPLDREEKDQYRLIATATDRQTGRALEPSSQFIIRVQDINDNPPVFQSGPYSTTVPEMANIGTSVIQVTATDADDPTYGNSAKIVYSVIQGQQYFTVDPQSGIVHTAVPDMDRETQAQYLVVLQARDMGGHQGGLTGTTTVTVHLSDVNDNPPRFSQSMWSFSVSELAVPGVEIGRLSATDADLGENARMDFTIVDGEAGDTFNITGLNQEAVILLNKAVDYERHSTYSLAVEVQNPNVDSRFLRRGPFKDRAMVRITVLNADEPPRFSRSRYRLDVSENCPPACVVGRVAAVDPDTGLSHNIKYSIDPESDPEALFRIASDNGLITTAMELDREQEQWHNITVIATQRDSPNQVTRVAVAIETLDLNDNAPELDRQYNTAVCDSSTAGQVVQVIRAIDKDQSSYNSPIHFSIPPETSSSLNFSVRERGDHTASLLLLTSLKALPRSSSLLTLKIPVILCDDASDLSSTGTVTVTLCPCQKGGMWAEEQKQQTDDMDKPSSPEWERQAVCLPLPSNSPLLGVSTAAMLAILACASTFLVVVALSLSLRRQKRDTQSPVEDDEIRENIITYDDEGGGEADTAAFDIVTLKSAPQSMRRAQRLRDSKNMYSQDNLDINRTFSWSESLGLDPHRPVSAPLYGRYCYSIQTLPAPRNRLAPFNSRLDLTKLAYVLPGSHGQPGGPLESGSVYIGKSRDGSEQKGFNGTTDSIPKESETGSEVISESHTLSQDQGSSQSGSSSEASSSFVGHKTGSSPHCLTTRASVSTITNDDSTPASVLDKNTNQTTSGHCTQEMPFRTMEGTLLRGGGGISLARPAFLYPEAAGLMGLYGVGRQDYVPHLMMPLPGGAGLYERGWSLGKGKAGQANTEKTGGDSLTNRMADFLQHRLALVTFDPMQPPYDSLQTYGLEGSGSQATSLSSLESEVEKDMEKDGFEEWGPKFQRLLDIFRERENEKDDKGKQEDENLKEEHQLEKPNQEDEIRDGKEAEHETKKDKSSESNETGQEEEESTEEMEKGKRH
ncbi:cadherin-11-like isoform X2 [Myxocyprinus asiaticus]|uniref:cadherin-11-like isoform X2 n=1 Tax=Myxocyprinus asiaticus TaxID=70543 RepID=UPI0022224745|nr:cadherin-11-like isoform X2 [Myxocyprinus asiaticus]